MYLLKTDQHERSSGTYDQRIYGKTGYSVETTATSHTGCHWQPTPQMIYLPMPHRFNPHFTARLQYGWMCGQT